MPEITSYNNSEKFEIIDNETKINENLNKLEKKSELLEKHSTALKILNTIDSKIPGIDIDLAYDKEKNAYHFISGENGLDFPIKLNSLSNIGDLLILLFNKDLLLEGDKEYRGIADDSILGFFHQDIISNSKYIKNTSELSKKEIEELFTFVMQAKGINIKDWNIGNLIGKKENLGIKLGEEKKPFAFKKNDEIEITKIETKNMPKIISFIKENINTFNGKDLLEIKTFINSNSKYRRELSLLFLANSIKNGYKFDIGKDNLSYIKNFSTDYMKVRNLNNPTNFTKINFEINGNTITIKDSKILKGETKKLIYGTIKFDNPFDIKILNNIIN